MSGVDKRKNGTATDVFKIHSGEVGRKNEKEIPQTKRLRIDFEDMYRDDLARLVGNVDILKDEDSGKSYTTLNRSFLNSCIALVDYGRSLAPLLSQYKKFVALIKKSEDRIEQQSPESIEEFSFSLSDFGPFSEGEKPDMTDDASEGLHKCSQGEIYRFLTKHFGVECPNERANDEFLDSLEAFKKMEKMADFPFSMQLKLGKGPGMSFSMSRREDVGNHNRKVFEAVTALRKDRNILAYVKNPEFFEDSSEEERHSGDVHVIRELVKCKYYEDGRYSFFGNLVLRGFLRNGIRYVNMRIGKRIVFKDLEKSQVALVYNKGEDVVYMLMMETMMIYKIVCRHFTIAMNIYNHLTGIVPSN
ncbi:hypothetical protein PFJ87_08g01930 [Encephalitozoon hellem]|uniref:Uncharacterized protein n=1 Tax=Encephalitozoon hellem TaxID=27973 RepID=A0ABY8CQR9_ENCHE|nr:hypothetical protein PFJ87_08g01930 [Encephalitozoon hellem]